MSKEPRLTTEGRLSFIAASGINVRAQTPLGTFNLFKIMFGPDGSIYVPFPYLETKRGLLAESDPATEPDPKTLQLRRGGVVVEYDAKFSHHASGRVHFSRDGQGDVLPGRQGFVLADSIGVLFMFNALMLDGFERQTRADRRKELGLAIAFAAHPPSLQVTAKWFRKHDIQANAESTTATIGPHIGLVDRASGQHEQCVVLGQPAGSPLSNHVVLLSAREVPLPSGVTSSTAIFLGGWDHHENKAPATPRMLSFMYPFFGDGPPPQKRTTAR